MREEPGTRAEVEAARAWAVPYSVFLGRTVQPDTPLWKDTDRLWALALAAEEANTHTCGQPVDEAFHPENEGGYVVDALRCHGCKAIADASKEYANNPEGLYLIPRKLHA